MKELIERIEWAEGPSYALDCEIWDAIYPGERRARFDKLTAEGQPPAATDAPLRHPACVVKPFAGQVGTGSAL